MNTYAITRAMIESAVAHGLKEIEEDPKRSARRLVDLGKQFSKNRFQDLVFSVMQEPPTMTCWPICSAIRIRKL